MTISAAQIREARRLLRRTSSWVAKLSGVGSNVVLLAQRDAEISAVDPGALRAIQQALAKAGVDFTAGGVRLRTPAR